MVCCLTITAVFVSPAPALKVMVPPATVTLAAWAIAGTASSAMIESRHPQTARVIVAIVTNPASARHPHFDPPRIRCSTRARCGYSAERPWNERIFGFWITPSRISIARLIVGSAAQDRGPEIPADSRGTIAWLISQVAESQSSEGLWSTA